MNQEKIGKFIASKRKEKNLTQEDVAQKIGVSKNAVSKWERGLCLMDIALLKPLSEILDVEIVDILSGEKVEKDKLSEKYNESINNLVIINKTKEKAFAPYGFIIMYAILVIYNGVYREVQIYDLLSLILMTVSFKFFYNYKLNKANGNLIVSIISFVASIFCLVMFIIETL